MEWDAVVLLGRIVVNNKEREKERYKIGTEVVRL
jgi:hypothetical protein